MSTPTPSSRFHRRRPSSGSGSDAGAIKHRIIMSTITDEENDALSESNSTEPSLANSSVSTTNLSSSSFSRYENMNGSGNVNANGSGAKHRNNNFHASHPPQNLNAPMPLHSNSSLLDMTRDDSHDDDNNLSHEMNCNSNDSGEDYRSPDTSLLDYDEEEEEVDAITAMERSIANISASISGSFCTKGDEVETFGIMDCQNYLPDQVHKKVLFSDRILKDRVMTDLNYLLGSATNPCCSEKNLFTACLGIPKDVADSDECEFEGAKIRNRAGESWRARAYRIKRLREERMIQDSSYVPKSGSLNLLTEANSLLDENGMSRSTSFSHSHTQFAPSKSTRMRPKQEVNVEPLGCMIGDCIEPISPLEGNDMEVEWKSRQEYIDEQDLCYDSDPGISSQRSEKVPVPGRPTTPTPEPTRHLERSKSDNIPSFSPRSKKKWFKSPRSRRRKVHFESFDSTEEEKTNAKSSSSTEKDTAMDLIRDDFYGSNAQTMSFDESVSSHVVHPVGKQVSNTHIDYEIRTRVQDALNETWTLTWHPAAEGKSKNKTLKPMNPASIPSPRCIQLWFERGNRVRRNDIVEPKLMWRDAYHPDLASQRKLNFSTTQGPNQICLLSICRIIESKTIDRKKYPFAKQSSSFIIRTSDDEEYIFEALNQKQRDHIVHTWKLVVARLASQAVVGDGEGMVGEFFVSSSFGVQ